MSDAPPTTAPDETYRPISGVALAGLIVSGLFAVVIAAALFVGVVKGSPIFFPIGFVLVALVGFGLSFAGHRIILASEGTRSGAGIAKLGMGLALVSGLGYAAYSMSIGLAVGTQADTFLIGPITPESGFLTLLQSAPKDPFAIDKAFLLTVPPASRGRARPEEPAFQKLYDLSPTPESQGYLTTFRNHPMVRMLSRGGKVESLGMREWDHDKQSFKVIRNYRLETPEATMNVVLEVDSAEGEQEGQLRRWYVMFSRSGVESSTLTPLGTAVRDLRDHSSQYLKDVWLKGVHAGTIKFDGDKGDESKWEFLIRDQPEDIVTGKNLRREMMRKGFRALLKPGPDSTNIVFPNDPRTWPTWNHDEKGRLWIRQPLAAFVAVVGIPANSCEGSVVVRTKEPLPLEKMTAADPKLEWEVESVKIDRIKFPKAPPPQ